MAKHHIEATVNGDAVEFLCETEETLLDVLRDTLHLTGSKEGCGSGDCGACSVTLDGRLVCSCLVLGCEVGGRRIETIEGMAKGEALHPLQQRFLENAALQCGICTPGFLVASKALLERKPDPTETEIRYWLAGNLCRCTGYDKIVSAVMDVAAAMRNNPAGEFAERRAPEPGVGAPTPHRNDSAGEFAERRAPEPGVGAPTPHRKD